MATITALPRRSDGAVAMPGQAQHLKEWDMGWASGVPSDLTASGTGTAVISGGNGTGKLVLTTAATINSSETISLPSVDSANVESYRFDFWGLVAPASGFPDKIFFACDTAAAGGGWRTDTFNLYNNGSDNLNVPYTFVASGRAVAHNIGLLLIPARKILALMSGDQVLQAGTYSAMTAATITPKIQIQTLAAVAQTVSISRITLDVRTN